MQKERVVIIGSGPAGLTAALYTARAQFNPVVIVGPAFGGQAAATHEIENYPGFIDPIQGPELAQRMKTQAEKFGARFVWDEVIGTDFSTGTPFTVKTHSQTFVADAVIIAIGADPRKLNVPGELELIGQGVSYCGTCDGFLFRNRDVVVVGGGDSAVEEAIFLTQFAKHVNVIHRRDTLRAGAQLQERAFRNPKLSFTWNTVVERINHGADGAVNGVTLRDVDTDATREQATDGVFIFIGHDPNSDVFKGQLATDDSGYLITDDLYRTNVDGVFAAGEIQDPVWRQVATSVGQGTSAAMSTVHWLLANEGKLQALEAMPVEEQIALVPNT